MRADMSVKAEIREGRYGAPTGPEDGRGVEWREVFRVDPWWHLGPPYLAVACRAEICRLWGFEVRLRHERPDRTLPIVCEVRTTPEGAEVARHSVWRPEGWAEVWREGEPGWWPSVPVLRTGTEGLDAGE